MGILSLRSVCHSFYLYGYGFLSGVKFCMRVGLLSGQVFSPFGELWLAGSHGGGGITSGISHREFTGRTHIIRGHLRRRSAGIRNLGRRRRLKPYGGICILQACWRTWFIISSTFGGGTIFIAVCVFVNIITKKIAGRLSRNLGNTYE